MKFLQVFLALFLISQAKTQQIPCPPGYDPVEVPPGSDNFRCESIVGIICPGGWEMYIDATIREYLCCPPDRQFVIYDEANGTGVCCAKGQIYVGNAPNGQCVAATAA
ncbi:hypothetical protein WG66_014525 [Moniliophthora roreri]|nr:hypothetical protein WG66_014525 [Moniliophthora roreri]